MPVAVGEKGRERAAMKAGRCRSVADGADGPSESHRAALSEHSGAGCALVERDMRRDRGRSKADRAAVELPGMRITTGEVRPGSRVG